MFWGGLGRFGVVWGLSMDRFRVIMTFDSDSGPLKDPKPPQNTPYHSQSISHQEPIYQYLTILTHTRENPQTAQTFIVFIMIRSDIVCTEQPRFQTNGEILWVRVEVFGVGHLFVCAFYNPREDKQEGLLEVH